MNNGDYPKAPNETNTNEIKPNLTPVEIYAPMENVIPSNWPGWPKIKLNFMIYLFFMLIAVNCNSDGRETVSVTKDDTRIDSLEVYHSYLSDNIDFILLQGLLVLNMENFDSATSVQNSQSFIKVAEQIQSFGSVEYTGNDIKFEVNKLLSEYNLFEDRPLSLSDWISGYFLLSQTFEQEEGPIEAALVKDSTLRAIYRLYIDEPFIVDRLSSTQSIAAFLQCVTYFVLTNEQERKEIIYNIFCK